MKKLKLKLTLMAIILFIGSIINLYFSSIIHFQLKTGFVKITNLKLQICTQSIASEKQHLMLFLCLEAVVLLLGLMLVLSSGRERYESDMKVITSKISTPVAAGQSQHGSARWLDRSRFRKAFAMITLKYKNPIVKELMVQGYDTVRDKNKAVKQPKKQVKEKPKKQKVTKETKATASPKRPISIVSKGWDHSWIAPDEEK